MSVCRQELGGSTPNPPGNSNPAYMWPWLGPPLMTMQMRLCTSGFVDGGVMFAKETDAAHIQLRIQESSTDRMNPPRSSHQLYKNRCPQC